MRFRPDTEMVRRAMGDIRTLSDAVPWAGGYTLELPCLAKERAAELIAEAKRRLEAAGFDAFPAGHRLFVQTREEAAEPLLSLSAGPWNPSFYESGEEPKSDRRAA